MDKIRDVFRELPSRPGFYFLAAGLIILFHFLFVMKYYSPAISGPDAQGYYTQARLVATNGKVFLEPQSVVQYIGPHWHYYDINRYYTTFAPGFPLILAGVSSITAPETMYLVNPVLASLSLAGFFFLCLFFTSRLWALAGLLFLAAMPFFNEHVLFGDAHICVAFFLVWGLNFLFWGSKRNSAMLFFTGGLFFGFIPAVRYGEALYAIALGIVVFIMFSRGNVSRKILIAALAGILIPVVILAIHNQISFGAFWRTGYSIPVKSPFLSLSDFVHNAGGFVSMLLAAGAGLFFPIGIVGLILMISERSSVYKGLLLVLIVVPSTLMYMSLSWPADGQSMRFLLPSIPLYIVASVWLMQKLAGGRKSVNVTIAVLFVILTWVWGIPSSVQRMSQSLSLNKILASITENIEMNTQAGDVLITKEGISQNLDLYGKWKLADINLMYPDPLTLKIPSGLSDYFPQRTRNADTRRRYSFLSGEALKMNFIADAFKWAGKDNRVFILADRFEIAQLQVSIKPLYNVIYMQRIPLPKENAVYRHNPGPPGPPGRPGPTRNDWIFDFYTGKDNIWLAELVR
ncbi:MAG: hypothetical protein JXA03_07270 [Bacteroidales bacterium]|nr:hypothetical protein [Bacteroidales bacterium]